MRFYIDGHEVDTQEPLFHTSLNELNEKTASLLEFRDELLSPMGQ